MSWAVCIREHTGSLRLHRANPAHSLPFRSEQTFRRVLTRACPHILSLGRTRARARARTRVPATSLRGGRWVGMGLDHERLDVYRLALDFLVFAHKVLETLPRGRGHLSDQLTRASTSIVLNIAEGAGKHSKADKRRYYLSARGSATESAALLDVLSRLGLLDEHGHQTGKELLVREVSMLIKLAQSLEDKPSDS